MTTLASGIANIFGALGSLLLRLRDRLQPPIRPNDDKRAREKFRAAVTAIRQANASRSEDEIARDVEEALREVREARRAASGR